eukprot:1161821-Pelagomonas_calceolata.AAC.1
MSVISVSVLKSKTRHMLCSRFYCNCFKSRFQFLMLVENVSPAADQPESRAVSQPPFDPGDY